MLSVIFVMAGLSASEAVGNGEREPRIAERD